MPPEKQSQSKASYKRDWAAGYRRLAISAFQRFAFVPDPVRRGGCLRAYRLSAYSEKSSFTKRTHREIDKCLWKMEL